MNLQKTSERPKKDFGKGKIKDVIKLLRKNNYTTLAKILKPNK